MKTTKPENFQKLLDELRSGKRNQGAGMLRSVQPNGVTLDCCLGVACDISEVGFWVEEAGGFTNKRMAYVVPDAVPEPAVLPRPVLDWLGIDPEDASVSGVLNDTYNLRIPKVMVEDEYTNQKLVETAAEANDGGLSFETIADLLEQEYMS